MGINKRMNKEKAELKEKDCCATGMSQKIILFSLGLFPIYGLQVHNYIPDIFCFVFFGVLSWIPTNLRTLHFDPRNAKNYVFAPKNLFYGIFVANFAKILTHKL